MQQLSDLTILIAEDERPVRMLLRVVLEAAGARVIEGDDGAQALRLFDLHTEIDLVCTDINMPNLDGPGLIDALKLRRRTVPIVVCSALDLTDEEAGIAGRVDGLVQKPFHPSDLVRTLRAAADRGAERRSAAAS
ncbi:MAG: response regulator [Thermoleophilia bacterium]|nr:response regulator [Thermoleophilia bacterium]